MIDSVIRVSKTCYSQTLLEERKYEIKKIKWWILSMIDLSSSDNEFGYETENESENESKEYFLES